ncbi:hypothetical protein BJY00DRAFT_302614 [Aspergillus carlsbadensis]|nr:hypothetical protein BJY00DRAFT_302614 [Aspergillus carlsbadensis]
MGSSAAGASIIARGLRLPCVAISGRTSSGLGLPLGLGCGGGLWEAICRYPKAVMWSGYDINHYGEYNAGTDSYQITIAWQNGLSNAISIGTIIRAFANGYFVHKFSYHKVLLVSLVAIYALPVLLVGQLLCRIPWGVFTTMAPAYASEVCPLALRGYLLVYSPWHFIRIGNSGIQHMHSKETIAMIIHINEIKKSINDGTSYLDCFHGVDLRCTKIACMAFAAQLFYGSAMGGTLTFFFVQAGLPKSISFKMSIGGLGIASVGTIISYSNYAQAGLMLGWLGIYYITVGPICYAIISKVSSTRLRNKSVCLSWIAYYVAQIVSNSVNAEMLNPTAGNWRGKTGFFWGGCSLVLFAWSFFRLPETRGRTFEELDILFAGKVPTPLRLRSVNEDSIQLVRRL